MKNRNYLQFGDDMWFKLRMTRLRTYLRGYDFEAVSKWAIGG